MKSIFFKGLVVIMAVFVCGCQENRSHYKPNIIFIMADDHAMSAISAYKGHFAEYLQTPNIDRIGKEGMILNHMFSTNAICGPSRAAILTGMMSHHNGFYKNEGGAPFDSTLNTFPQLLQDNGYNTCLTGKWHLWSTPQGFDYYKYHVSQGEQGIYYNPVYNENGKIVEEKGYATKLTADFALDWLKNKRDTRKPFCLLLQFKAPHRPWNPDSIYMHLFDSVRIAPPPTFRDDFKTRERTAGEAMMTVENHLNREDLKMPPPDGLSGNSLKKWLHYGDNGEKLTIDKPLGEDDMKYAKYSIFIKDYLACVKSIDDQVGRVLDYLEEQGLSENTIVIYTSDQGFYLGEHGWFDKRFMYEPSLTMPFLIRYPSKVKAGEKVDHLMTNLDIAPTLLEAAGVSALKGMQGTSFWRELLGEKSDGRQAIYYHYYEYPYWHNVQPHYGIRTERYKLIHYYYDMDDWELFDLEEDPDELNNIYKGVNLELVDSLKTILENQRVKYGDTATIATMRKVTEKNYRKLSNENLK